MYYYGDFICYTVEKPWLSNIPFKSCVPPGLYELRPHDTEKYPDTFVLVNHDLGVGEFEGDSIRYGCLIHIANYPRQVNGCIGPGLKTHPSQWGVYKSRVAMEKLRILIKNNNITHLEII